MALVKGKGCCLAAASVFCVAGAAAHADETLAVQVLNQRPLSTTVDFRDLDLKQPKNVARLYDRLNAAADGLCGPRLYNIFYNVNPLHQACVDAAVQKAVARLNLPR